MKIGEFAKLHNVTIDTIRHYMDLGLILTVKDGSHYVFDRLASEEMCEIKELKKMGFSLEQILKMISYVRVSRLQTKHDRQYYSTFFEKQKSRLLRQRERIDRKIQQVAEKLHEIQLEDEGQRNPTGIPILFLANLACPVCGTALILSSGQVENNQIFNGQLSCSCGSQVRIEDGIIIVNEEKREQFPYRIDTFTQQYAENTSEEFVGMTTKVGIWNIQQLNLPARSGQTILELGIGTGFSLQGFFTQLPAECYYVGVDYNIERLRYIKLFMETYSHFKNCIFICADYREIPLKNECVDLIFDNFGSLGFNRENPGWVWQLTREFLKPSGEWLGNYFAFLPNSSSLVKYAKEIRSYLLLANIQKSFPDTGYREIVSKDFGYVEKNGEMNSFYQDGDRVFVWAYLGQRWG